MTDGHRSASRQPIRGVIDTIPTATSTDRHAWRASSARAFSARVKVGFRPELGRDDAIQLACRSLWEAADADSATGGPDVVRGIYPVVAAIDVDGWERIDDDDLAGRFDTIREEASNR